VKELNSELSKCKSVMERHCSLKMVHFIDFKVFAVFKLQCDNDVNSEN
jgi:hypothetical protein